MKCKTLKQNKVGYCNYALINKVDNTDLSQISNVACMITWK